MSNNRKQILEMLAEGKINSQEAERLLQAVEGDPRQDEATQPTKRSAKYLRVQVVADEGMTGLKGQTQVNVRVPMKLLRAGVRLWTALKTLPLMWMAPKGTPSR